MMRRSARCAGSSPTRATGTARSWSRWTAGIPRARAARSAGTFSMNCGWMIGSGGAPHAEPGTIATSMPHGICWRRVFASWPVVTTGSCAWMREMHARKRFWCRCSQRKREAGSGIELVQNGQGSVSNAVKQQMLLRSIMRLVLAAAAALLLSACPSLTERAGLPPSLERAEALERAGDAAAAARVYEELAAQNSGAERNALLLRAARGYLAAHRAEDAARVLALPEGPLSAEQSTERALSTAQLALERGQGRDAWQQLAAIPEPRGAAQAARYHELQARPALATGRPAGGLTGAAPQEVGPHIALLLPITGRAAAAAISVREGFMTGYYQTAAAERPRVRVYDTGTHSVAEALAPATNAGADFIVGPLTREEVVAAAAFSAPRAPLLALNFLPAGKPPPAQCYHSALSPEDEAPLGARTILDGRHRRGV